ncbi:MAG: cytochrome c protein [Inquilinus sp.]|nr:cytochrome c protein [Inquilinus sp.]
MRSLLCRIAAAIALVNGAAMIPAEAQEGTVPPAPNDLTAEIDPLDNPYHVDDGKVDRGTYNGYRRYHSSCHVCHGPDGLGSSFAPALVESLKSLDYVAFAEVVVNGRQAQGATGNSVMPSFAFDPNVMEYMNDIYGYLKARTDGALDRGRPQRLPK